MNVNAKNPESVVSSQDLDTKLREEFILGAAKFANNPMHLKLKSDIPVAQKLAFVPSMLFFVMGFKDLMEVVRFENPSHELEKNVNTHSDEDSNHWQWYLNDLSFISAKFKKQQPIELITEIWQESTLDVRKTIYAYTQHMLNTTDAASRMLMVEVLEITFNEFKKAIHPVLKEEDLYSQLDYFGKMHQETEENHTTGISDDEIGELIDLLPQERKEVMIPVVNQLFHQMYKMAECWSKSE